LILDAAMRVFAAKGFHNTRLEDIGAEAGFSKAALYNYYENKETIFLSLAVREHERLYERLAAELDPAAPLSENLRIVLHTTIRLFGEHFPLLLEIMDMRCMSAEQFATIAKHHDMLVGKFREYVARMGERLAALLRRARQRGEFSSELDDAFLARCIGAQIRGVLFDWKLAGKMGDVDTTVSQVLTFVMHGVSA